MAVKKRILSVLLLLSVLASVAAMSGCAKISAENVSDGILPGQVNGKKTDLTFAEGSADFALKLFRATAKGEDNALVSPLSVMIALAGENAIAAVRAINGATNPEKAEPGTLRYDFAPSMTENVVHSSDSPASAEREVAFWFKKEELYDYAAASQKACKVLG